jgi:ATP-dependent Clp protease ATP-binding subunit ClpB
MHMRCLGADNVVMFNPLDLRSLVRIVELQIKALATRLKGQDIALRITHAASALILQGSYDPAYGARPVR